MFCSNQMFEEHCRYVFQLLTRMYKLYALKFPQAHLGTQYAAKFEALLRLLETCCALKLRVFQILLKTVPFYREIAKRSRCPFICHRVIVA